MPPARPLITLLTDFGDRDYFVASMKGVILSLHPESRIVDITHQIAPHQIEDAGYVLNSCYRYFPEGTVHVAVVDPGVGSGRRALLVSTAQAYFLAPDNGLLTAVLHDERDIRVWAIDQAHRRETGGPTFDGRDLFAPVAALLAAGRSADSFGRRVDDVVQLPSAAPHREGDALIGRIAYVDRFGNLISNLGYRDLEQAYGPRMRTVRICLGSATIAGLVLSYAEGDPHRLHALINSNGYLEIFLKEGSAAERLAVSRGATVEVLAPAR